MSKRTPIMAGVTVVNNSGEQLYIRGRTIQSPSGPIKIFILAQDPAGFQVSGGAVEYDEIGVPDWLKSVASTALNIASAAGVPGAGAIKTVADATGLLKTGGSKAAAPRAAKAAAPRAAAPRAMAPRAMAARLQAAPAHRSAVRHLPKGAKIPKKFVEVIPVALTTDGAGFID